MELTENENYLAIKERMKRIDLRSPYYALAAADLTIMDTLLVGAHVTIANKEAALESVNAEKLALVAEVESANAEKLVLVAEVESLTAEVADLQAQIDALNNPVPEEPIDGGPIGPA